MQDAYVSVLNNPGGYAGTASVKTYLYRIVINKSIDIKRRLNRFWRLQKDFAEEIRENARQDTKEFEHTELVRAALKALRDKERIPLELVEMEGLSYHEIAEILNLSLDVVRIRIFRAREKLRTLLVKTGKFS